MNAPRLAVLTWPVMRAKRHAVFLREDDTAGGHASHHLICEKQLTGFRLQGKIFDESLPGHGLVGRCRRQLRFLQSDGFA